MTKGRELCLNGGFRATAGPATLYLALATNTAGSITATTAMGTIVESADPNYQRKPITFGVPTQETVSKQVIVNNAIVTQNVLVDVIKNSALIDYGANQNNATAPITYGILTDSPTKGAGNPLGYLQWGTAISPQATQPVQVAQNNFAIALD